MLLMDLPGDAELPDFLEDFAAAAGISVAEAEARLAGEVGKEAEMAQ